MKYTVLILLALCLTTTSCSHKGVVDPKAYKYLMKFKDYAKIEGVNTYGAEDAVDIILGDLPPLYPKSITLGYCMPEYLDHLYPTIILNIKAWDNLPSYEQEEVVLHELGHCVLHRGHDNDVASLNGLPMSLMVYTGLPGELAFNRLKPAYIHELFHPKDYKFN